MAAGVAAFGFLLADAVIAAPYYLGFQRAWLTLFGPEGDFDPGRLPGPLAVTPTARSGEKPKNQVSRDSLVVPVLPASGLPTAATRRPVPRSTTPRSIDTT